jgi:hemin uptake protein HemP
MEHKPLPAAPAASSAQPAQPLRLSSAELLQGQNTLEIDHGGQRYLLRVTRENKLILTK